MARQNNFLLLTDEEWLWVMKEIINDFPDLTISELNIIISNGVKGYYNDSKYPMNINATLIFKWIKNYLNISDGFMGEYHPAFCNKPLHRKK